MIRSKKVHAVVFRFSTDAEWHKALHECGLVDRLGIRWKLIRANYKARSMVMVRTNPGEVAQWVKDLPKPAKDMDEFKARHPELYKSK